MTEKIPLPKNVEFKEEGDYKATLTIEPLYPGYGLTLGNALRRVLLSSIPGAAVSAIKIKGVDHEFSTIDGVTEDVVEIILNFKKMPVKIHADTDEEIRLSLKAKGKGAVKADSIEKNSDVEIVDKDFVLFNISDDKAEVEMELFFKKGRGYVPTEQRTEERTEIGVMDIDSAFTPLRNVAYNVSNVRVGQMTNYDKLVMDIETNGTITAREAVGFSADLLIEHFHLLTESNILEILKKQAEMKDEEAASEEEMTEESEDMSEGEEVVEEKKKRGRPKKTEE